MIYLFWASLALVAAAAVLYSRRFDVATTAAVLGGSGLTVYTVLDGWPIWYVLLISGYVLFVLTAWAWSALSPRFTGKRASGDA